MPTEVRIEVVVDPTLLDHFTENLKRLGSRKAPETAIAGLIATILDSSAFPVTAQRSGSREVRIAYRLRSFSQPIF